MLISGCAIHIKDETFCSPMPFEMGAVCDNFLTSRQVILDQDGWNALQSNWVAQGKTVECTSSTAVGDIKAEIEKLCSVAKCNYDAKSKLLKGLSKLQVLGRAQARAVLSRTKGE